MRSVEYRLSVYGGAVAVGSGILWTLPAVNTLASIAGIIALVLIISRLGYQRGFYLGIAGIISSFAISYLSMGIMEATVFTVAYAAVCVIPAFLMGWASRNLYAPETTALYGFLPMAVLFLFFMFFYAEYVQNLDVILDSYNSAVKSMLQNSKLLSEMVEKNFGTGEEAVTLFLKEFNRLIENVVRVAPGFLLIGFLGLVVISLAIAGHIAGKLSIMMPRFRPFYHWKASGLWLLPTILGLIPVVFRTSDLWFYVGLNILIVTGHVYMIIGLAIVESFFKRMIIPTPIRIIFYAVLLLAGPVSMGFLAILGLADTKFNFKREMEEFENKEEEK